jgi:hypothetical protein
MIRDPSDGSVRDMRGPRAVTHTASSSVEKAGNDRRPSLPQSGLPDRTEDPARLKKSEDWLREYRRGK